MKILIISFVLVCSAGKAQMQGVQREDPSYQANGRLIQFVAVPKSKTLHLYLAGREAAELNLKKEAKLLSVRLFEKDRSRDLKFQKHGNVYEILGVPTRGNYELDLGAEIGNRPDSVRMSIDLP